MMQRFYVLTGASFACLSLNLSSPALAGELSVDMSLKSSPPEFAGAVKVDCVSPHACCEEAQKVIDVLHKMVTALTHSDWEAYGKYLDEHCTTFDENSKKLISGKENVIADLKCKVEKNALSGHPLKTVTIDQPYAKVTGDTAVVTFIAYREYGGKHPYKERSQVTDVFVRHDGSWKRCHFRGAWKRV